MMIFKSFWKHFISGEGAGEIIKNIEKLKLDLRNFLLKKRPDKLRYLILAMRLEHLQIRKHQKIALQYLQKIEELVADIEIKDTQRENFIKQYKVK